MYSEKPVRTARALPEYIAQGLTQAGGAARHEFYQSRPHKTRQKRPPKCWGVPVRPPQVLDGYMHRIKPGLRDAAPGETGGASSWPWRLLTTCNEKTGIVRALALAQIAGRNAGLTRDRAVEAAHTGAAALLHRRGPTWSRTWRSQHAHDSSHDGQVQPRQKLPDYPGSTAGHGWCLGHPGHFSPTYLG